MDYTILSRCKFQLLTFFAFLIFTNLEAQQPAAIFAKNHISNVEIAGAWEFDLGNQTGMRVLTINQTGSIAIGTFNDAPVIVNVMGDLIKFKCDERNEKGEKVRYMFKGKASKDKISGEMTTYFYSEKTYEKTSLTAIKKAIE